MTDVRDAPVPASVLASGAAGVVPQRVTFVLPTSGEHDSRTRRMAADLARRGHRVTVLARRAPGLPDDEEPFPGVRLRRVTAGEETTPTPDELHGFGRALAEARRMAATARRAAVQGTAAGNADSGADLYHAMGFLALPVGLRLARSRSAPLVYDARDLYAESGNIARLPGPLRAIFAARERSWARRAGRVFTVNEALATELTKRLGVPRPAVVMNCLPASSRTSRTELLRTALDLPGDTGIVLYHGVLRADRGLRQLADAMQEPGLEDAHLVFMGQGPLADALASLASEPATRARFHVLPPVTPEHLLEWVSSADVGAIVNQPRNLNERLSTPNKLFECLTAGTPVVSSDFPGRHRIIADDPLGPLGALCDPTRPASIAAALRAILDLDEAAREELRERCRTAARERYAWEPQMQVVLDEYTRLTGRAW